MARMTCRLTWALARNAPVADTLAYCLLRNHFHLLVYIKSEEEIAQNKPPNGKGILQPSQQFSNLFNAYAKAINQAYGRTGSLFQHPFGRIPVSTQAHFTRLITYIHQNPQKHGFVSDFRDWDYSSYHAHLSGKTTHLKRSDVLGWFGGQQHFEEAHRATVNDGEIICLAPEDFD